MIKYERAREKEFETVAEIIVDAYKDSVNKGLTEKDFLYGLTKLGHYVNVAKEGDKIVGSIIFGLSDNEKFGNCGFLIDFAVSKKYRKRGIGTELLKSAIGDLSKMLGNSEKVIRAHILSSDSHILIEKFGFQEDVISGRDDELHVKLELPSWIGS